MKKNLIIGIGNNGRQDDGLGWAFLESIESKYSDFGDFEYRYQLQVEDAELIANYENVFFVDADFSEHQLGYLFQKIIPSSNDSYSSHALVPSAILDLTQQIYKKFPHCFTLGISGVSFELKIGLTIQAQINLKKSLLFFEKEIIENYLYLEI